MTNTITLHGIQRAIIVLLVTSAPLFTTFAAIVPENLARTVAVNFSIELAQRGTLQEAGDITLTQTYDNQGSPVLYIYNIPSNGFLMVSAEDEVYPILGWSTANDFSTEHLPPALEEWIKSYLDQINFIRAEGLLGDSDIRKAWKHYLDRSAVASQIPEKLLDVAPLITAKWNQGTYYNALCPVDQDGPSGRALVGCVAVAMSQVMYYYRYPQTGTGTSSFYHGSYGLLSANHGNTTFNWNAMGDKALAKSYEDIAEFVMHVGVSVSMNYGANASGAYSQDAADALKDHFGYDNSLNLVYKGSYTDNAWANLLRSNLDDGHPMYYHGYGSGGHAFNVDGYQGNNHFHFNWGWGGLYDGYFYLSNLNPGGNSFTSGQGAIINFKPPSTSYPLYCSGSSALDALAGSVEDGSGPIAHYENQSSCTWLIQPTGLVDRIEIKFNRFSTQQGLDVVYIYDGVDQNAPLLATISGDTIFPVITTTGGSAFIRFVTNGSTTAQGWMATYEAFRPVFCSSLQLISDPSTTFDDGSGATNNYNHNSNCKYLIQPPGQVIIRLSFNYFAIEDGKDFLRIYDPTTSPSTLLASLTGNTIPQDIVSAANQLLLIFFSDGENADLGWEVSYTTIISVPEPDQTKFDLFPNPATDAVTIRYPAENRPTNISLFDLNGRELTSLSPATSGSGEITLDLPSLPEGLYMLMITHHTGITRQKLLIRKH